jgi:hypothetical protein
MNFTNTFYRVRYIAVDKIIEFEYNTCIKKIRITNLSHPKYKRGIFN